MKIQVRHRDGSLETITIRGTWTVVEGEYMDRITSNGFDHFFNHDGTYDGWGGVVSCGDQEASEILQAMESKREIVKVSR